MNKLHSILYCAWPHAYSPLFSAERICNLLQLLVYSDFLFLRKQQLRLCLTSLNTIFSFISKTLDGLIWKFTLFFNQMPEKWLLGASDATKLKTSNMSKPAIRATTTKRVVEVFRIWNTAQRHQASFLGRGSKFGSAADKTAWKSESAVRQLDFCTLLTCQAEKCHPAWSV